MPLFKKSSSDPGFLVDVHRTALHHCRAMFVKDLALQQVMEYMSLDDNYFGGIGREEQITQFLDLLEIKGERSFALFVDFLKEHQKHLYSLMDETVRSLGHSYLFTTVSGEDSVMTGEMLRRLLKKKEKCSSVLHTQSDQLGVTNHSEYVTSEPAEQYIDCYSIPSKGLQQQEKWVKHVSGQRAQEAKETLSMSYLTTDVVFRKITLSDMKIPDCVRTPPRKCEVYVCMSGKSPPGSEKISDVVPAKDNRLTFCNVLGHKTSLKKITVPPRRNQPPPPVPPKPGNLPLLGINTRLSSATTRNSLGTDHSVNHVPDQSGGKNRPIGYFPQSLSLPRSVTELAKIMANSKIGLSRPARLNADKNVAHRVPEKPLEKVSPGKKTGEEKSADDLEDFDDSLLDCNVSMCSESELALSGNSFAVEDGKESCKSNDTYEPVTPQDERVALPMYSTVDLEKKNNRSKGLTKDREEQVLSDGRTDREEHNKVETVADHTDTAKLINNKEDKMDKVMDKSLIMSSPDDAPQVPGREPDSQLGGNGLCLQISRESTDPPLPAKKISGQMLPTEGEDDSSSSNSYYEDIDVVGRSVAAFDKTVSNSELYLNPQVKEKASGGHRKTVTRLEELSTPQFKLLHKGYLLIVETADACCLLPVNDKPVEANFSEQSVDSSKSLTPKPDVRAVADNAQSSLSTPAIKNLSQQDSSTKNPPTERSLAKLSGNTCEQTKDSSFQGPESADSSESATNQDDLRNFRGTKLAYDKDGHAFYIPSHLLKKHGEPDDEPWFYPLGLTSRQAALFLMAEKLEGCFVVYRSLTPSPEAAYNLSVCLENGDVVHYHLVENVHGDVMVDGHDHSFMTVTELVDYFSKNKSSLATRLRRPLRYARLPITPGFHYDLAHELDRSELSLTGNIIGQGYFGVVCAGVYRNRPVAVKVLQQTDRLLSDEDDFLEEAKSLMGLRHEHIVELIGVSCTTRPCFIVTEFASRGSVKECLKNRRLPSESVDSLFDICIQMTSAMCYLESLRYMLHRDLASRNFLMADDFCVKLADFGRARLVSDDHYQAPRKERICIKWASPEVLIDSRYSTKSDVWSIGVVFWEVFSLGERPYASLPGEQTAVYVVEGGQLDKPAGCPFDIYQLMQNCWAEDPQERPTFANLYEKLKGKSNMYYHRHHHNSLPESHSNRQSTANEGSILATPSSSKPTTPSSVKSRLTYPIAKKSDKLTIRSLTDEERRNSLEPRLLAYRNRTGTSSSETSIASGNGFLDPDRGEEDLTRSDRIRKSLRRLMKMKTSKAKTGNKLDFQSVKDAKSPSGGGLVFSLQ